MSDIEGRWIIELIEEIEAALASLEQRTLMSQNASGSGSGNQGAAKQKTNYENRDNGKHTEAHEDCPFVYLCSGECVYLQFICISIFFRNYNINLYLLCHGDEVRFPLK